MIGIVDYEAGNITSVTNAVSTLGAEFLVSSEPSQLIKCAGAILPGVGAAPGAMQALSNKISLIPLLQKLPIPLLGICLGMQILYEYSEEGETACLGVLSGTVRKFTKDVHKIPHMGWNSVRLHKRTPLMNGITSGTFFYFAHSYAVPVTTYTAGTTDCGEEFSAIVQRENYFGVQFHPEKSGSPGLQLLKNFISLCSSFPR